MKGLSSNLEKENELLSKKYDELKLKEHYLSVLFNFTSSIVVQKTIDDIVWCIAKNAIAQLGFEDCVVYLLDENREFLIQKAAHGPKNPIAFDIKDPIKILVGQGIAGSVALTGIPEIINDTSKDPRYIIDDEVRLSEISVPILIEGDVIGVIDSENTNKDFFSVEHLEVLQAVSIISANKISEIEAKNGLKEHQKELEEKVRLRTEELDHALRKIKKSNQELKDFAYLVSHDLRQPLRMISSYIQLIEYKFGKKMNEEILSYFKYAKDGANQMHTMIEDLLYFSRIENSEFETKLVDLNGITGVAIKNLETSIKESDCKLNVPELPKVKGIPSLLILLFQNLIHNAIKYRKKEIPIQVNITYKTVGNFLIIGVEDNGIGIDKQNHRKIFDLYRQVGGTTRSSSGLGIGLATCKKIIEKHKGKIWIESALNIGTTIYFALPSKPVHPSKRALRTN